MAEFAGVSTESIRQAGRWNTQAMGNCYLASIPRDYMRGVAGFDPMRKNFFIPRASLDPPDDLVISVFPKLSEWITRVESGSLEDITVCLELQM
jgi:hypothetical protein